MYFFLIAGCGLQLAGHGFVPIAMHKDNAKVLLHDIKMTAVSCMKYN